MLTGDKVGQLRTSKGHPPRYRGGFSSVSNGDLRLIEVVSEADVVDIKESNLLNKHLFLWILLEKLEKKVYVY